MLQMSHCKQFLLEILCTTHERIYDPRRVAPVICMWIFLLLHKPHSAVIQSQLDEPLAQFGQSVASIIRSRIRDDPVKSMLADLLAAAARDVAPSGPVAAGAGTAHSDEDAGPLDVLIRCQSLLNSEYVTFFVIQTLRDFAQHHDDVAMDIVRSEIIVALRRRPDADAISQHIFQLAICCFVEISQNAPRISSLTHDRVLLLQQLESQMRPEFDLRAYIYGDGD